MLAAGKGKGGKVLGGNLVISHIKRFPFDLLTKNKILFSEF